MRALVPAQERDDPALAKKALDKMREEIQRMGTIEDQRAHMRNIRERMIEANPEIGADILAILPSLSFSGNEANPLFHNRGDGTYESIGEISGAGRREDARAFAAADFDGDGDLDLAVHNAFREPLVILRNDAGAPKPAAIVRLRGKTNRFGIGARVTIESAGRRWMQELTAGEGFTSSQPPELHFGGVAKIDKLTVRWPGGRTQEHQHLTSGIVTITEDSATVAPFAPPAAATVALTPRVLRPGDAWPSIDLGKGRTVVALFSIG